MGSFFFARDRTRDRFRARLRELIGRAGIWQSLLEGVGDRTRREPWSFGREIHAENIPAGSPTTRQKSCNRGSMSSSKCFDKSKPTAKPGNDVENPTKCFRCYRGFDLSAGRNLCHIPQKFPASRERLDPCCVSTPSLTVFNPSTQPVGLGPAGRRLRYPPTHTLLRPALSVFTNHTVDAECPSSPRHLRSDAPVR